MSSEMLTILFALIGVGIALGTLIATLGGLIQTRLKGVDERLSRVEEAATDLRERMAKLEGFVKGLSANIQGKPT